MIEGRFVILMISAIVEKPQQRSGVPARPFNRLPHQLACVAGIARRFSEQTVWLRIEGIICDRSDRKATNFLAKAVSLLVQFPGSAGPGRVTDGVVRRESAFLWWILFRSRRQKLGVDLLRLRNERHRVIGVQCEGRVQVGWRQRIGKALRKDKPRQDQAEPCKHSDSARMGAKGRKEPFNLSQDDLS